MPAAWIMPRKGGDVSSICRRTEATSSAWETSAATVTTFMPAQTNSSMLFCLSLEGWPRLIKMIVPAPCVANHRAVFNPNPPNPPVIR